MLDTLIVQSRIMKNQILLKLGFTLFNKRGFSTVKLVKGKQVKSNPNRTKDYKMDDKGWVIYKIPPEIVRIKELHGLIAPLKGLKDEKSVDLKQSYWREIKALQRLLDAQAKLKE